MTFLTFVLLLGCGLSALLFVLTVTQRCATLRPLLFAVLLGALVAPVALLLHALVSGVSP